MAQYARRTCKFCGIRKPQPEMHLVSYEPVGVNGNPLTPRDVWSCQPCYYRQLEELHRESAHRYNERNRKG